MSCQNGTLKFGIFHRAFRSFLLVGFSFKCHKWKVINSVAFLCRHKKWSSHSKLGEICDTGRRQKVEAQNQSIHTGRMFGEKEAKPRRCFSWGCTCRHQKAKCETTFMHNTLRCKQYNTTKTHCAHSSLYLRNICIFKCRKAIAYVNSPFLRTKQNVSTTSIYLSFVSFWIQNRKSPCNVKATNAWNSYGK